MEMRSVADEPNTGAMIALLPSEEDAARLAVPGGEKPEDLHVTLCYWADASMLDNHTRLDYLRAAISLAANFPPFAGEAFGFAVFNPGDEACTVLEINGEVVSVVRDGLVQMVGNGDSPEPWNAHLTLKYGTVGNPTVTDRLGTIVFDRIRVAFGDEEMDFPFSGEPAEAGTMLMEMAESELTPVTDEMDAAARNEEDDDYYGARLLASINTNTWSKLPVADRETPWNADEAIARISVWAGGNGNKFGSPFLWMAKGGQPLNPDSYRLPIADVVNGRLVLIPRAVFSAGTILSGGHGYLEGVVTDAERDALKATVTEIYNMLQEKYQDPRVVAPWLRGRTPDEREAEAANMNASITAAINSSGWSSMPIADAGHGWDGDGARGRARTWADGDMRQYRRIFLWWDSANPENFGSYKLPIADIIDGTPTIIPKAVSAALGAINGARGGVAIPDADMGSARSVLERIQSRIENSSDGDSRTASATTATPVAPPREWFADPQLSGPTPLTVTADGRVYGHLAAWNVCHMGIADRCVLAPRSQTGYKYFRNGDVMTADGSMIKVGRLTVGTGHADARLGYIPAADHYDNTGTAAAIVVPREDQWGINVAGAVTADATPEQIAALRRSPLSGDWRRTREGGLELVAALSVNTPGFPIIASAASGEQISLVAAGLVLPEGMEIEAQPQEDLSIAGETALRVNTLMARIEKRLGADRGRRFAEAVARIKG
jgi:hypothetical protein